MLGRKIDPAPDKPHSFTDPQTNVCVFYYRDRGESWDEVSPIIYEGDGNTPEEKSEAAKNKYMREQKQAYCYLFFDRSWHYANDGKWMPISS